VTGDVQVLARIDSGLFYDRSEAYREEVRAWLEANGVDPWQVTCHRDVEVVLIDGPAIVYERIPRDGWRGNLTGEEPRVTHSLLRVPLPEHLADPL